MRDVKRISVDKAGQLLSDGEALVLDIRAKADFEQGHIKSAIHLDAVAIQDLLNKVSKSTPLLVYCYHGISSLSAAAQLQQYGFENVYSLDGGVEAWKAVSNLVSSNV